MWRLSAYGQAGRGSRVKGFLRRGRSDTGAARSVCGYGRWVVARPDPHAGDPGEPSRPPRWAGRRYGAGDSGLALNDLSYQE
jgi:hypothetical protein